MIRKWMAIMVFGLTCLSGCVSARLFSQGENVGYSFWNDSDKDVEKMEIIGIYQDRRKYLISSSVAKAAGWKTRWFVGGSQYMSDTGHKVPEAMDVSWRKMPPPGGQPYTGELMGPYRILVRSRIPQEALQLARQDGYSLGIEVSVGKQPTLLCWGVVTKKGASLLGTIMSGGQCNPEDVAWRKDIDWHKPGVWFPEKQ
jgi:hypothetical protein